MFTHHTTIKVAALDGLTTLPDPANTGIPFSTLYGEPERLKTNSRLVWRAKQQSSSFIYGFYPILNTYKRSFLLSNKRVSQLTRLKKRMRANAL